MTALAALEERVFTAPRICLFAAAGVVLNLVLLAGLFAAGAWPIRPDGTPVFNDFTFIWLSGRFAASPHPADAYDYAIFSAAQAAHFIVPQGLPYYHLLYPPTFFVFTYFIAQLPYFLGFVVWVGGTFLFYLRAIYAILPRLAALLGAAASIATLNNFITGQNGFLTAGLIGSALVLLPRRPWIAGIFLGFLTYKPQFGVLFPLALLAGREWRALASAAVTAVALGVTVAILFGADTWTAYAATLRGFDERLSPDARLSVLHQSVFSLAQWAGAGVPFAAAAQGVAAALTAIVVCLLWTRSTSYELKATALAVGALAVTPYVVAYDLCVVPVAAAFLLQDCLQRGFRVGERTTLLILFAVWVVAAYLSVPIGPVLYLCVLALVVRRAAVGP